MPTKDSGNVTYTTESGLVINIKPVSPMLIQSINRSIKAPSKPRYTVKLANGRVEQYVLDAVAAQDNPADKAKWDSYMEGMAKYEEERSFRMMQAMFTKGTEFDLPDNGWEVECAEFGIDVPQIAHGM